MKITVFKDQYKGVFIAYILDRKEYLEHYNKDSFINYEKDARNEHYFPFTIYRNKNHLSVIDLTYIEELYKSNKEKNSFINQIFAYHIANNIDYFAEINSMQYAFVGTLDVSNYMPTLDEISNGKILPDDCFLNVISDSLNSSDLFTNELLVQSTLFLYNFRIITSVRDYMNLISKLSTYFIMVHFDFFSQLLDEFLRDLKRIKTEEIHENDVIKVKNDILRLKNKITIIYNETLILLKTNFLIESPENLFNQYEDFETDFNKELEKWKKIEIYKSYFSPLGSINLFKPSYRGLQKFSYEDKPTIFRNINYLKHEKELIENYKAMFHISTKNMNILEVLCDMQHFGVPTRLLDITKDPLVALWMACSGNKDDLGETIIYFFDMINYYDSTSCDKLIYSLTCIANLPYEERFLLEKIGLYYLHENNDRGQISQFISANGTYDFNGYMNENELEKVRKVFKEIKTKADFLYPNVKYQVNFKDLMKTAFIYPKPSNERMENQKAGFLLFGLYRDFAPLNLDSTRKEPILARIIIANKNNILKELNNLGYTEEKLFISKERARDVLLKKIYK